jgi:hypothetical protein
MNHRITAISFALLISSLRLTAQAIPAHPLPTQLASATKVFISNAQDEDAAEATQAYDLLYQDIQAIPRYQIVLDPAAADLILELNYRDNPTGGVHSFAMFILDPRTRTILWACSSGIDFVAVTGRDKNIQKAIASIATEFNAITAPASGPPPTKK